MEACQASKAGGFVLPGKALAALSLPASEASCSKIQFEDEKPLVNLKIFGDSKGATLKVMIYGELSTAPKWATYYQDSGLKTFGYWDKFFQPKNLADFENYVKVVVAKYKGVIDYWDIWNEPWNVEWWAVAHDKSQKTAHGYKTSAEPERDFALLSKSAYTADNAQMRFDYGLYKNALPFMNKGTLPFDGKVAYLIFADVRHAEDAIASLKQ